MAGLPPLLYLTKSEADGIEEHEGDWGDQIDVLEVLWIRAPIQSVNYKYTDRETRRNSGSLCLKTVFVFK